ncbi:hypothetical protein DFAR_3460014 [Desulfarculales bacterium]
MCKAHDFHEFTERHLNFSTSLLPRCFLD